MRTKKLKSYRSKADILKIDCGVKDAEITFTAADKPELVIEYSKNLHPHFAEGDGIVTIRQTKKPLLGIPAINIAIPDYCVPSLTLRLRNGSIVMDGIVFNDVEITGGTLKTDINGCTFENLSVKAKDLNATADGITVKNYVNATAEGGNVGLDHSFCKKTECRMKSGNIGVSCSTCEYAVLDTGNGTVAANMVGNRKDYTVKLDGATVTGKENVNTTSGKSLRAHSATGSVVVDFSSPDRAAELQETDNAKQAEEIPAQSQQSQNGNAMMA